MTGAQGAWMKDPQGQRSMGALRCAAQAAGQSCVAGLEEDAFCDAARAGFVARLRSKRAQAALCAALAACAFLAAAAALV